MRRLTLTLILLLVSSSFVCGQDLPVPHPPNSLRQQAAFQFQEEHGSDWQIAWHEKVGTPATLLGGTARGYTGPPKQAGRAFLEKHKELFGIENAHRELNVVEANRSGDGNSRVQYRQVYQGIPVLNSGYLAALNAEGVVHYISGDYYPNLQVETTPRLQAGDVVETIRSDLGGTSNLNLRQEPLLSIFVDNSGEEPSAHLAYEARVERRDPLVVYKYVVDAQSGEILQRISLIETIGRPDNSHMEDPGGQIYRRSRTSSATGSGNVYLTNPLHGSPTSVTLHRLDNVSPQELEGDNIAVTNEEASDAESSTGDFTYSPSNTHFDEVMTYYHSDEFENWLTNDLGMAADQLSCQVSAETHSSNGYAFTYPGNCEAFFADADADTLGNPARERSIINHEYMHIASETYNGLNQDFEAGALDEGYSDFFAVADRQANTSVTSARVGAYVGFSSGRTVDNSYQVDDFFSNDPDTRDLTDDGNYSEHDGGVVLAGALWDFKQKVNDATIAAMITLESLKYLDSNPSFYDARNAMITAAYNTGYSQHECKIKRAFEEHGIGTAFVAHVSGPTTLDSDEQGTWTAGYECGSGSVSYAWEVRPPGSSTWSSTSGSSQSYSDSFQHSKNQWLDAGVRVTVTRGSETAMAEQAVGIGPSSCSPTPCISSNAAGPRPLGLQNLQARGQGPETAAVQWQATGRESSAAFVVQHRSDSTATWSEVGRVAASDSVTADTSRGVTYRFRAEHLSVGTHQFRLRVQAEGAKRAISSRVVSAQVRLNEAYVVTTYPNPVQRQATIELAVRERQNVTVVVYDVLGRRVTTLHDGPLPAQDARRFRLNAAEAGLSSGTYFVRVRGETFADTQRLSVVR